MRKKRTTRPWARGLRTGASVLVGTLALWLAWLVGDPAAVAGFNTYIQRYKALLEVEKTAVAAL